MSELEPPVPAATVARLPLYLRCLEALDAEAAPTVSSSHLAALAGVNAAKLRKDLSHLGSYGTRGVGYDVGNLMGEIRRELGVDETSPVIVIGLGNLGQALAKHGGFAGRGFPIVGLFDIDPNKIGQEMDGLIVQHLETVANTIAATGGHTAIIATPPDAAQVVTDQLIAAGITSVLNFAPTGVVVPDGVALRQVDLAVELQILSYYRPERVAERDAGRDRNLSAATS